MFYISLKNSENRMRNRVSLMVTCTRCGKDNPEGSRFCVSCGEELSPERRLRTRRDDCFGSNKSDECFGISHGNSVAGVVFGLIIVFIGVAIFFGQSLEQLIGPVILIVFGSLIVIGAFYTSRRGRQ